MQVYSAAVSFYLNVPAYGKTDLWEEADCNLVASSETETRLPWVRIHIDWEKQGKTGKTNIQEKYCCYKCWEQLWVKLDAGR